MTISQEILSDITTYMKYCRYIPELGRRETWNELVTRNMEMHIRKYPTLEGEIRDVYTFVYDKKVLPSMRSLQFSGKPIEISPNRIYNCAYLPIDDWRSFHEIMFLLLGGTGVGYSVQKHHVSQLPEIQLPRSDRYRRYLIGDSIEGWADAIKVLMKSYFFGGSKIEFDFRDIRPKGARLITSGGKAPGPQPLKECIVKIQGILDGKQTGDQLTTLEVHDIVCHIADAVLAGGIRRAALIALFSATDDDMIACKSGNWWELNPQRGRANNSAVLIRYKADREIFMDLWERVKMSGSGEPGILFSNDKDWGTNPSLRAGTKVLTMDGIYPIEQLDGKEFVVPNLNGNLSKAKCWKSGTNIRLWKLTFDNGATYYASPEHKWPIEVNGRYVKCASSELKVGDKMPLNRFNRDRLYNGELGSEDIGFLIGWLYGDGSLTRRNDTGNYVASFVVSKSEKHICDRLLRIVKLIDGVDRVATVRDSTYEFQVGNEMFIDLLMNRYDVRMKSDGLPSGIWNKWSDTMIRGFISGLFSADGHVPLDSHGITLTSSHKQLINDVQELLGFYGIKSRVSRKVIKNQKFPNGKVYDREYETYVLRTTLSGRVAFASLFRLAIDEKQRRLDAPISGNVGTVKQKYMVLTDIQLTDLYEDVWDISVNDDTHCFQLSQVTTGNCAEIALRPYQFCNLTEVNVSNVVDQDDLNARVRAAAFIGTLQAGYTDFHYLRPVWKRTTEKDALIGVSMTGIGSNRVMQLDLKEAARVVKDENKRVADIIGINPAARTTTVKPAGTTSLVLGCSSGIHAWHSKYYIRRIRVGKNEAIYQYLAQNHPELVEDEFFRPHDTAVISVPQMAPEGATLRTESPFQLLERVKQVFLGWVKTGHRSGNNMHNVSTTVSVRDHEWDAIGEWMWDNRDFYNGITVLPFDGGTYVQAPFEDCDEETYNRMAEALHAIDLSNVVETDDLTNLTGELACSGGSCEII